MEVILTSLPGVVIIEPKVFGDDRGFFLETFQQARYRSEAGIYLPFVQDNHSFSRRGVLRGLHYQKSHPTGNLVRVVRGEVFEVAVDVNPESRSFGEYFSVLLSGENRRQLYIPPGYAHGFQVVSEEADFEYKCTGYYNPEDEGIIAWNDPDVGINWPVSNPTLSSKDAAAPFMREVFSTDSNIILVS